MNNEPMELAMTSLTIENTKLIYFYNVGEQPFKTEIHYEGLNLFELQIRYTAPFFNKLVFIIGFLEGLKFCSLFPDTYNISSFSDFIDNQLVDLFYLLYEKIFAQHRWENNNPDYSGPQLLFSERTHQQKRCEVMKNNTAILFSCGGGKDSLVSMKLLEGAKAPYAVSYYSHSIYGDLKKQHMLINNLLQHCAPTQEHYFSIHDEFLTSSIVIHQFSHLTKTLCHPETPCSIFETLPIMLAWGYNYLCMGHERGATSGNFFWNAINKEVNHQWGKSFAAEKALNAYIHENLIENFHFFSILQPVYDLLIFRKLNDCQASIKDVQSCNIEKPWCKRCPKCLYIWLCMNAYLEINIFEEDLFNHLEVQPIFLQMMGQQAFRPFECIGEIDETYLALYYAMKRGCTGNVIEIFKNDILPHLDIPAIFKRYNMFYNNDHLLPDFLLPLIQMQFEAVRMYEGDFLSEHSQTDLVPDKRD